MRRILLKKNKGGWKPVFLLFKPILFGIRFSGFIPKIDNFLGINTNIVYFRGLGFGLKPVIWYNLMLYKIIKNDNI